MPRPADPRRWWLVLPAFALVACTSGAVTDATSTAASPTPTSSPSAVSITDAASLAAALRAGTAEVTSARISIRAGTGGISCSASGGATTSNGRLTGLRVDGPAGVEAVETVFAAGTVFARPYDFDGGDDGIWHTVAATGGDENVVAVRPCLVAAYAVVNVSPLADALEAGTGFQDVGVVTGGNRYSVDGFSPAARGTLPALFGAVVVPDRAFLDVDRRGRLLSVTARFTVGGVSASADIDWSGFGADLALTTPAGSAVAPD